MIGYCLFCNERFEMENDKPKRICPDCEEVIFHD